jgi:hypothetical protein
VEKKLSPATRAERVCTPHSAFTLRTGYGNGPVLGIPAEWAAAPSDVDGLGAHSLLASADPSSAAFRLLLGSWRRSPWNGRRRLIATDTEESMRFTRPAPLWFVLAPLTVLGALGSCARFQSGPSTPLLDAEMRACNQAGPPYGCGALVVTRSVLDTVRSQSVPVAGLPPIAVYALQDARREGEPNRVGTEVIKRPKSPRASHHQR